MSALGSARLDTQAAALARAVPEWRRALGEAGVATETARYNRDTSSFSGEIAVALRPVSVAQVQEALRIAQRLGAPVYPISTGHNWGYGTSVPARSPCAILDLGALNRIVAFDEEVGVVTLEPGVTQADLCRYLEGRALPFMVPVTGAGGSCSILANALERGFGVTPLTDHFGAVMSMKVVLPDGEVFESYARAFDAAGAARAYRWGTGPYLDGLFSQSNLGVVVEASVALQARPERYGALLFVMDGHQQVEDATPSLRRLLGDAGHTIGAINVMSRARVECMLRGWQRLRAGEEGAAGRAPSLPSGAWFGLGSVYGTDEHYRATCRLARRSLAGGVRGLRIYTPRQVRRLRWLSRLARAAGWGHLGGPVERLEAALDVVRGVPSSFALPLAYARSGRAPGQGDLDPARDGCGLFWYSPLVPLRVGVVGRFIDFVAQTCGEHGLPAPMTLTTLSSRCYAGTVPLLFDRTQPGAEARARACFEALYEGGLGLGFVPYRLGAPFMPALARTGAAVGRLARTVKGAVDPNLVLAPGRYSFD